MKIEECGPRPKVALVSIGVGRLQRGFERMFTELFAVLKDDFDVTLFKSGGTRSSREKVPPFLGVNTAIARALPLGGHAGGAKYKADCLAFGSSLLPELLRERFDVILESFRHIAVNFGHQAVGNAFSVVGGAGAVEADIQVHEI